MPPWEVPLLFTRENIARNRAPGRPCRQRIAILVHSFLRGLVVRVWLWGPIVPDRKNSAWAGNCEGQVFAWQLCKQCNGNRLAGVVRLMFL